MSSTFGTSGSWGGAGGRHAEIRSRRLHNVAAGTAAQLETKFDKAGGEIKGDLQVLRELRVVGSESTAQPSFGSEFLSADNWTLNNWSGSFEEGWKREDPSSALEPLSENTVLPGMGFIYTITIVIVNRTLGNVTIAFGGTDNVNVNSSRVFTYRVGDVETPGFVFKKGSITSIGSGTSGNARIFSDRHRIQRGQNVVITSTANYNGTWKVLQTAQTWFEIGTAFVGSETVENAWECQENLAIIPVANFNGNIKVSIRKLETPISPLTIFGTNLETRNQPTGLNAFVGLQAGQTVTTTRFSVGIGTRALAFCTTGGEHTAVGFGAMEECTTSTQHVGIGFEALRRIRSGSHNVAVGPRAFHNVLVGSQNVALGRGAGYFLRTGSRNTYIGHQPAQNVTEGSANTFIGASVGEGLGTGSSFNIFLGAGVGPTGSGNVINNELWIDNSRRNDPLLRGILGNPTVVTPASARQLVINGRLSATQSIHVGSDAVAASSAALEILSTTKGFLPPRMTGAQAAAIPTPAEGLMIYVTDSLTAPFTIKGWYGYDGSGWVRLMAESPP